MTYLEIINEVLSRLREDTVSSSTESTYSQLIGRFVKQAYIECANAYEWPQLDETVDTAISASDTSFTITSGDSGEGVYKIHSVYDVTNEYWLREKAYKYIRDRLSVDADQSEPIFYAYGGETADGTTTIHFYPTNNATRTLRVSFNRKPNLKNTYDDSTYIKLPDLPIILRAHALAISERGEDGGANYSEIDLQANMALGDAISLYESNNDYTNSSWYVV